MKGRVGERRKGKMQRKKVVGKEAKEEEVDEKSEKEEEEEGEEVKKKR